MRNKTKRIQTAINSRWMTDKKRKLESGTTGKTITKKVPATKTKASDELYKSNG